MTDLDDLRKLAPRVPRARQRMIDNLPGYGNGSDGPSTGHGDRTLSLALKHTMSTDPAVRDLARLDRLCPDGTTRQLERFHEAGAKITRAVSELHELCNRWAPTDRMVDGLRTAGNDSGDGWCKSHWRVGSTEPPRTPGSTMCRWCEDWTRKLRDAGHQVDMPPREFVAARARGAPWRELIRHLPRGVVDG